MSSKTFLLAILAVAGTLIIGGAYIANDWTGIGVVGSVASIVGFFVTTYVALTVRELRQRYVRQAVLKACVGKLQAHRRNLSSAIRNRDADDVRKQLSRIKANYSRLAVHFGEQSDLQLNIDNVEVVLKMGKQIVIHQARDVLPQIDEKIEELSLLLVEIEWSSNDV